ncbi:MAG: hypothetical protein IIB05_04995 [Bacteroidetes bacterium]|nr:hypothetical protein [Bacteroidota bacterium]
MDRKLTDVRKVSGLFFFMITAVFLVITSSCQNGRGKATRDIFEKYEGQKVFIFFAFHRGL